MFVSTHKLDFEVAQWTDILRLGGNWSRFRIGTCEGLWRATKENYEILAIDNKQPGNGHFQDVLDWFENSCKRDRKNLCFLEILNDRFAIHLTTKRGFKMKGNAAIKTKFK